jgi:hypothetical protein
MTATNVYWKREPFDSNRTAKSQIPNNKPDSLTRIYLVKSPKTEFVDCSQMLAVGSTDLISWRAELTADGQSSAGWRSRLRSAVKMASALNRKFLQAAA